MEIEDNDADDAPPSAILPPLAVYVNRMLKFDAVPSQTTLSWNSKGTWARFRQDDNNCRWIAFDARGRAIWYTTGGGMSPLKLMESWIPDVFDQLHLDVMEMPGDSAHIYCCIAPLWMIIPWM